MGSVLESEHKRVIFLLGEAVRALGTNHVGSLRIRIATNVANLHILDHLTLRIEMLEFLAHGMSKISVSTIDFRVLFLPLVDLFSVSGHEGKLHGGHFEVNEI